MDWLVVSNQRGFERRVGFHLWDLMRLFCETGSLMFLHVAGQRVLSQPLGYFSFAGRHRANLKVEDGALEHEVSIISLRRGFRGLLSADGNRADIFI